MIGYNGFNNGAAYNPVNQGTVGSFVKQNTGYNAGAGQYSGSNYQQNQVLTASPEQILIMLFDAAIRFNREAQAANDSGKTGLKLEKIHKVFNIITEFSNTLNHSIGGEIADDLEALYQFNLQELNNARKDTTNKHLKFVENFLIEWRETWQQVIEINRNEAARHNQQESVQQGQGLTIKG